jgi:parallel beta-helix repeat protein
MSNTWYMIAGVDTGIFDGFVWNGASWTRNSTINTSLPDIGSNSAPNIFNISNTWYMISGSNAGTLFGFNYTTNDILPPTYNSTQTNNTVIGKSTNFSIYVNDETALNPNGQYVFSTNNTGTWVNETAVNFTTTPQWANVTKTLNSTTSGILVGYKWYFTDNVTNHNNTGNYTVTTTNPAWQRDKNINASLPDIGTAATLSVFYKDSTWYMIAGVYNGIFYGFNWTGSAWQRDWLINASLFDLGDYTAPNVFYKDSTWYMIAGENLGFFYGFNWTGSAWQRDKNINASLPDIGTAASPSIFYMGGTWYIIAGASDGTFYGFNWTGSAWQRDWLINASLPDIGDSSIPNTFYKDGTWYMIAGEYNGVFYGFNWTGSAWQGDKNINASLPDIGSNSAPNIFYKGSTWYIIAGASDGTFYGFNWTGSPDITSPTYSNAQTNNTIAGQSTNFSLYVSDDNPLYTNGQYVFSTNNTGTWMNDSPVNFTTFSTVSQWANVTKTLNSTGSLLVSYRWYLNDSAGNNNNTGIYNVTTTGGADTIPPTYNSTQTNNTEMDNATNFSLYVNDETALNPNGYYIFSTNNTGTWANDSAVNFTATPQWANITKTSLNSTPGTLVDYKWYLWDNASNENVTSNYSFIPYSHNWTYWQRDKNINASLPGLGSNSVPNIFYKDSTWYMIAGVYNGIFYGFNWTGSAWQRDWLINASLPDIGTAATPSVFYKDSTWYMIAGESTGVFYGFNWTGSAWQTDNLIKTGLPDIGAWSAPSVFYKDSTWYMIAGEQSTGTFYGFNWTGSAWQRDWLINASLPAIGTYSAPSVFNMGGTWYMIAGEYNGVFYGFNWNGTAWPSNYTITYSLPDIGTLSKPCVFSKDSTWYMIAGESAGKFFGFNWTGTIPDTTPPTYSNAQTNNTATGQSTNFSLYINDETALNPNGQYVFSTNNTGTWVNESTVNFTATPQWANVTKTLNSTGNLLVSYRWYLTDNATNRNNTIIYNATTTYPASITIGWCADLTQPNVIYYLNTSINSTGTCINVTATNVTIDCQNWGNEIIYGNQSAGAYYGVYSNQNYTTVRNCEIKKGTLATTFNTRWGIYFTGVGGSYYSKIQNSNTSINFYGIQIEGNSNNLTNITASSNSHTGIIISGINNTLSNITANSNSNWGILISSTKGNNSLINITTNLNNYGIYLDSGSDNNTLANINTTLNTATGIYLVSNSGNNLTNITSNNNIDYGIYMESSDYANLTSITANSNSKYGVVLVSSSNNSLSEMNLSGNIYGNFYISGNIRSHFNHTIDTGNIVDYDKKIYYNYSISNYTYNLTTAPDAGTLICAYCDNITVDSLNLSHRNVAGVYFYRTNSSRVNNVISSSNFYGVLLEESSNNLFSNMLMNNSFDIDVYMRPYAINNTFLNASYTTENITGVGTELIRKWYYRAYVNDTVGSPIEGANVSGWNSSEEPQFSELTNSSGFTPTMQWLLDYINNGTDKYFSNNYTMNASKETYTNVSKIHNLTTEQNLVDDVFTLSLLDTTPPAINVQSPISGAVYNTGTIFVNATANEAISSWKLDYNGTNYTLSSINSTFEFLEGDGYNLKLWANDSAGNWGLNDSITFSVDLTKPIINIQSPINATNYSTKTIFVNATADENIDTWMLDYNGTNYTLNNINSTFEFLDGVNHNLNLWGNDSANNWGLNNTIYFTVDTVKPSIIVISPINNTEYTELNLSFNVSLDEAGNWCGFDMDSSSENVTMTKLNSTYFGYLNESMNPGPHTMFFYCNDTSGNYNSTYINFSVSNSAAIAIDLSPELDSSIHWNVTSLPVDDLDADANNGLDETGYYVNISATNTKVDLYLKADGDLNTDGGDTLGLGNETYSYNITNNTVPRAANYTMTTGYVLVGSGLNDGDTVFLKFYLDVGATQPPGLYYNNVDFKAVRYGETP